MRVEVRSIGACERLGRLVQFVVSCLVVSVVAGGPAPIPDDDVWREIQTENFTVYSDVPGYSALQVAEGLEGMREFLARTTKGIKLNSPHPTSIFVFRNAACFAPYNIGDNGKPDSESAGYFVGSPVGNFVALQLDSDRRSRRVIYHEYIHYVMHNNVPELPVWLGEGLAEYYSTMSAPDDAIHIGRPIIDHLRWIDNNEPMPLRVMFAIDHDSPDDHEGERRGSFYAQSWAFTHFLMSEENGSGERFNELFQRLGRGEALDSALREAYGADPATLEQRFLGYLERNRFSEVQVRFETPIVIGESKVRTMSRAESLLRRADLLAHHRPFQVESFRAHIEQARKLEPDRADLPLIEGRMAEAAGDLNAAAAHFREATRRSPESAIAWSQLGHNTLARYLSGGAEAIYGKAPPPMLEAREQLARSLELDPDDPEALASFGETFHFDAADLDAGILALDRAARALPSRGEIVVALVGLHVQAGNRKAAENLIALDLDRRRDPTLARRRAAGWPTSMSPRRSGCARKGSRPRPRRC